MILPAASCLDQDATAFLGVERSVTGRRWRARLDGDGERAALALAQAHGLSDLLARVLAGRGVTSGSLEAHLRPALRTMMPDPSCLTDMDRAAERLAEAVQRGESIALFGDYDVDGATSVAVVARFLIGLGCTPIIHIPDRIFEGYGPNIQAIRALAGRGTTLLVTVDCGTVSHEPLAEARRLGLDTIVVDHHQTGASLPEAVAVVNPKRQDDLSGLEHLAAVGLAFLLCVATNRALRRRAHFAQRKEPDLLALLPLVALGTVCDVVPLTGLNRAFVQKGLIAMGREGVPGLRALAVAARSLGRYGAYQLGFLLGPRINAGGRIGRADLGARLLMTEDAEEAEAIAAELDRLNTERQAIEAEILADAMAQGEAALMRHPDAAVVVAHGVRWHPGVVGIVASRLKERFNRPALAIAMNEHGIGTGSGRSIDGVDLGAAVRGALDAGLLEKGGGHAMAAGLTLRQERLTEIVDFFKTQLADSSRRANETAFLSVDCALSAAAATSELLHSLERAGPFGAGNPEPRFALPHHSVRNARVVGKSHIRVSLAASDGRLVSGIAFRAAGTPLGDILLQHGRPLHVAGMLRRDDWGGRERIDFCVQDAAPAD
jgi:single-stranded-DNA-specific exonuclease